MTFSTNKPNDLPNRPRGFDGPVTGRCGDHLNRWPFAREIYGIATTGPKEWSVRVGIYGEWGTGKTSVLEFISEMARRDGQIVIRFNPWEHSTKDSLWRAFVLAIFAEPKLANIIGTHMAAIKARAKGWISSMLRRAKAVESGAAIFNEKGGKAVGVGLEVVKSLFSFSANDLESLRECLGGKRVIVLIDDLDRTAPELVPEILFALKELMDVPGFSYICAFDPVVVGLVLGRFHPGFGGGLDFLDKIIDYPRWLPPPPTEGIVDLALADANANALLAHVPESALRNAIPLLPPNPRAVRQFIRLLALLKPQVERHNTNELRWPLILAANILKVRHPEIAHAILNDEDFWSGAQVFHIPHPGEDSQKVINEAISEQVKKSAKDSGLTLQASDLVDIETIVRVICSHINLLSGINPHEVVFQLNAAEAPAAVTWKEFDAFLQQFKEAQTKLMVENWMQRHAGTFERRKLDVYRELLDAAVRRYAEILQRAENASIASDQPPLIGQAELLFALLKILVFEFGGLDQSTKQIGDTELATILKTFVSLLRASLPVHTKFLAGNEEFILKLFQEWSPDVLPLVREVSPYGQNAQRNFHHQAGEEVRKKLWASVLPRFARQIIQRLKEEGFVERLMKKEIDTFDATCLIWDSASPIWTQFRAEAFQVLGEAGAKREVFENSFQLLDWFVLMVDGHAPGDRAAAKKLLSNQQVFDAMWNAATASRLASRAAYRLKKLPEMVKGFGVACNLPAWWQETLDSVENQSAPAVGGSSASAPTSAPL